MSSVKVETGDLYSAQALADLSFKNNGSSRVSVVIPIAFLAKGYKINSGGLF